MGRVKWSQSLCGQVPGGRPVVGDRSRIQAYLASIPVLSISLMTSARHTAVVEKYKSPDEMVLVYRKTTVYVAATRVITVRQYSLNTRLTFSEGR